MMDYDLDLGLRTLKSRLPEDARNDFNLQEARLRDNLRREQYGGTETIRHERAAILDALNQLAQHYLRMSFNDLCEPAAASAGSTPGLPPAEKQVESEQEPRVSPSERLPWIRLVGLLGAIAVLVIAILVSPKLREWLGLGPPATPTPTYEILYEEDFEETAVENDPNWQIRADETGNHFRCVSAPQDGPAYSHVSSSEWKDYIVEADVLIHEPSTQGTGNIQVRVAPLSACVYDFSERGGELNIETYSPFDRVNRASTYQGLAVGKWYTVRIEAIGSSITVLVDEEKILHTTDADIGQGGVAYGAGWGLGVCFDNIRVISPTLN
jgi:hypothetical protein